MHVNKINSGGIDGIELASKDRQCRTSVPDDLILFVKIS
jgi:hypothetical protein